MDGLNKVKIAILDSGICANHNSYQSKCFRAISLKFNSEIQKIEVCKDYDDEIGHGTAVFNIINRIVPNAEITIIKIFDKSLELDKTSLEKILQYIPEIDTFQIINLSLGLTLCEDISALYEEWCSRHFLFNPFYLKMRQYMLLSC